MSAHDVRTVRSFCRVCTSTCGILVDVSGQEVIRVRGNRDHPLSQGYTCSKGRALPQMHHHPERIERPLMKVDGTLRPTTWEACLDDIGTRVRGILDRYGPEAVGVFFGSGLGMDAAGYRVAQALHAALGTPAKFSPLTIDGTAKVLISDLVGGSAALNPRPDYDNAHLVLYIGTNPLVSHGHTVAMPNPVGTLRELRERARVWVVDPRRTETARMAHGHLAPRPGTDHAIMAFLVRELLRVGADRDVLDHRTVDADMLATAVAPFTLEHTEAVADVPAAELSRLLAEVRAAGRIAVETGTGVTMSAGANVTQWLSWALMILTGSMNRPGGVWFHPGFTHQLETFELPVSPAGGSFGPGPRSRPETQSFLGEWPCAVLADEIEAGNIRAVLNLGGHLVTAFPDTTTLVPALEKLDLFATIEIIANETTALSTHVLPTKDQLERADLTLWDHLSPRVAAQHTQAVVAPVGDRRSAWWVLAELGRRLGYDLADTSGGQADDDARLAMISARARRPLDELIAEGWAQTQEEFPAAWVERHLDRLGGWRLAPRLLVDQLAALTSPAPLVLVPRRQKRHLNSQFTYLGDTAEVLLHPDDAATAGVADAQQLTVRTAHGELTGIAKLDPSIRRGAVSVPHGHQGANVNRLTGKNDIDLITGMAHYSGIPVSVHPAADTPVILG
ncbi:molybdopterin-containing oxidoreductase family protein [Parafrankia soli]|uniref:molybdopterin-containing oxidoreductase family protein n=1 Tax=Parafrankia soli TaxID=2599596 RepID=UPI000A87526A|nr:molybdopterin-dependent oxidoreductase [Parafrankia soli]